MANINMKILDIDESNWSVRVEFTNDLQLSDIREVLDYFFEIEMYGADIFEDSETTVISFDCVTEDKIVRFRQATTQMWWQRGGIPDPSLN